MTEHSRATLLLERHELLLLLLFVARLLLQAILGLCAIVILSLLLLDTFLGMAHWHGVVLMLRHRCVGYCC